MDSHEIASLISVSLVLIGVSRYIYATVTGKAKPSKVTWWVFTIVSGLILATTLLSETPNPSVWQPWAFLITALIIAILAIFKGQKGWGAFDKACVMIAGLSIAVWLFLLGNENAARIVLLLAILSRFVGVIPTFIKAYREPKSEDLISWIILTTATVVNLFAVRDWGIDTWPVFAFPVYAVIEALPVLLIILLRRNKKFPAVT